MIRKVGTKISNLDYLISKTFGSVLLDIILTIETVWIKERG